MSKLLTGSPLLPEMATGEWIQLSVADTGTGIPPDYLPALPAAPLERPTSKQPNLIEGHGETVLVVEDEATLRQVLAENLKEMNYRVLTAQNGREALALLEQHSQVALVLSDIVMPGMGGIALFQALRQKGASLPVVLMTGHPLEKELDGLRAQELNAWLPKPIAIEQLAQVVAQALETDHV